MFDGSSWLVSIIDYIISTADAMFSCVRLPSVLCAKCQASVVVPK